MLPKISRADFDARSDQAVLALHQKHFLDFRSTLSLRLLKRWFVSYELLRQRELE